MKDRDKPLALLVETEDPGEVAVICSKLEAFGIACSVQSESAGRLYGVMIDGLARTKIYVTEDCLELAREALKPGPADPADET
jgi:hypothetical protein